ncbi:MAG TPA: EAL domain-containing protein [Solirubrobacterales bacterium]|nr:EAL domain-containing protein [Solirubrobacterales bacterium]
MEVPRDTRSPARGAHSSPGKGRLRRGLSSARSRAAAASDPLTRPILEAVESALGSEALTRAILEAALDCVVVIDYGGRVVEWNPAAERTFGYTREQALGRELADLIIPERLRGAHRLGLARHLRTGRSGLLGERVEMPALRADGTEIPIELAITKVSGEQPLFAGHMRDITERRRRDAALEEAEHRYRSLVERLPVVAYVAELGPQGRWTYVSPQIEGMLGYTTQEWIDVRGLWASRIHPEDRERVHAEQQRLAREADVERSEYRMLARDGSVVWVRDRALLVDAGDGSRVVEGLLADVTEEKQAEERLRHLATHDDLTGLRNRRCFEQDLASHLSDGSGRGAVLMLDLDHLKFVNDSLGHAVGDRALRGLARALEELDFEGAIPARLGDDQFAVLLPDASESEARGEAARLVELVRTRGAALHVTASVGVVPFDAESRVTAPDLLVAADLALADAKEGGRDRFAVLAGRAGARLAWVERLRAAIEDDRLVLYSQPIVDLRTGGIRREELLIRMLDEHGLVIPPASFLPAAERFGLIRDIDRWVVAQGLELMAKGRPVAVNLSGKSINDAELMTTVEEKLGATGMEPGALMFEVTETAAATAMEQLGEFAARIETLGCQLALDDFGTGFGTFTYLRHLPVHSLKIDTQFVRGMAESPEDRRIVRSIVAAGKTLALKLVGEGVEDAATVELLRDYGVGFAQGYHLGRPSPLAA